jgi:hypothetical protein
VRNANNQTATKEQRKPRNPKKISQAFTNTATNTSSPPAQTLKTTSTPSPNCVAAIPSQFPFMHPSNSPSKEPSPPPDGLPDTMSMPLPNFVAAAPSQIPFMQLSDSPFKELSSPPTGPLNTTTTVGVLGVISSKYLMEYMMSLGDSGKPCLQVIFPNSRELT